MTVVGVSFMFLHKSGGVTRLTATFSKLHAVPEWGAEAVSGGGSSAASSTGSDASSTGSDRIINRAEPCFLTQASCYILQQAHVINAIRERSDKHVDDAAVVVSLIQLRSFALIFIFQERYLERQGIVDPMFHLNAPCNLVNSELASLLRISCLTHYSGSGSCASHRDRQICDDRRNLLGEILGQVHRHHHG